MNAQFLVVACSVCGKFACGDHPSEKTTFGTNSAQFIIGTIHVDTGYVDTAKTFTAEELGIPHNGTFDSRKEIP